MDALLSEGTSSKPITIPSGIPVPIPGFKEVKEERKLKTESAPASAKNTPDKKKKRKREDTGEISLSGLSLSNMPSTGAEGIVRSMEGRLSPDILRTDVSELALRATYSALQTLDCVASLGHVISTSDSRLADLEQKYAKKEEAYSDLEKYVEMMQKKAEEAKAAFSKTKENMALLRTERDELKAKVSQLEEQQGSQEADLALFYSLQAKLEMMAASESEREKWDYAAAVERFQKLFPGVPVPGGEVPDTDQEEPSTAGDGDDDETHSDDEAQSGEDN